MQRLVKFFGLALLTIIFVTPVSAQYNRGLFGGGFLVNYQNPSSKRALTPEEARAKKVNDDIEKIKKVKTQQEAEKLRDGYKKQLQVSKDKMLEYNIKIRDLYEAGFDNNIREIKEAAGYIARSLREIERIEDIIYFAGVKEHILHWEEGDFMPEEPLFEYSKQEITNAKKELIDSEKEFREKYAPKITPKAKVQ